jgi:ankyrin repeat protein
MPARTSPSDLFEAHAISNVRPTCFVHQVLAPQGHLLFCTSRPAGLDEQRFAGVHRLQLNPLCDAQQTEVLTQRLGAERAAALAPYVRSHVPIDTETKQRVTANPLMLSMVISIAELRQGMAMPTSTVELYELASTAMLARSGHGSGRPEISNGARALLQAVFFEAHSAQQRIITEEHLSAAIKRIGAEHSALAELRALVAHDSVPLVRLLQVEPMQMQASHLSFQEFYTVQAVSAGAGLPNFEWNAWWTNVVLMGVQMGEAFGVSFAQSAGLEKVHAAELDGITPDHAWRLHVAAALIRQGLPSHWLPVMVELVRGVPQSLVLSSPCGCSKQAAESVSMPQAVATEIAHQVASILEVKDPLVPGAEVMVLCDMGDCSSSLPGHVVKANDDGSLDCTVENGERQVLAATRTTIIKVDGDSGAGALLRAAASLGVTALVDALLKVGVPICLADTRHRTALHLAASGGHAPACRALVAAGADPFHSDGICESAYECALAGDHIDCLHIFRPTPTDHDLTRDSVASELHQAAQKGLVYDVEAILAAGETHVDSSCANNVTALHLSCRHNRTEVVSKLIAAKANVESRTRSGITPLLVAVEEGCLSAIDLLCDAGVNASASDTHERSPLTIAAERGRVEVISRLLAASANVNHFNSLGQSVLTVACSFGHAAAVSLLLQHKADGTLHHPDIRATKRGIDTPLIAACRANDLEVVNLLLAAGVSANHRPPLNDACANLDPWSPLIEAAGNGRDAIVAALLAAKADPNLNLKGNAGPLYFSACNGHMQSTQMLVDAGADIDAGDLSNGRNGLWWAAKEGHAKIVGYLIDSGANVNHQLHERAERAGTTPLHMAASAGRSECVAVLLEKGADMTLAEWKGGNTALHIAASGGYEETVRELLAGGAQRDATNTAGETAAELATAAGHERVAKLILEI